MWKTAKFVAVAILLARLSAAQSTDWFEHDNQIGIFLTEHPTVENAEEMSSYNGGLGPFLAHVVLINPRDEYGFAMTMLRAYRLTLVIPAHVMLIATVPPGCSNALYHPDYHTIGFMPVVDDHCTLITLTVGVFTDEPSDWYLAPVRDGDYMRVLSQTGWGGFADAYPASGSFSAKVFSIFPDAPPDVVDTEAVTWGGVKALYR